MQMTDEIIVHLSENNRNILRNINDELKQANRLKKAELLLNHKEDRFNKIMKKIKFDEFEAMR